MYKRTLYIPRKNIYLILIPKEFTTTKIEISPDKTAIKKAIKEGKIVPGAVLLQKQNLQIK